MVAKAGGGGGRVVATWLVTLGGANPAVPAAHNLCNCHGTGDIVPFVNCTLGWGVVIATVLSILSIVPGRLCTNPLEDTPPPPTQYLNTVKNT